MLKTQSVRRVRSSNKPSAPAELPEPPRPEDVGAALRALGAALRDYIDRHSCGSGYRGLWPAIMPGHPVHAAVCAVERFCPGTMLPVDGRALWIRLVELSRRTGIVGDVPKGDARREDWRAQSTDTGYAASALWQWVRDELGRAAAPSGVKPSAPTVGRDDLGADALRVADWIAGENRKDIKPKVMQAHKATGVSEQYIRLLLGKSKRAKLYAAGFRNRQAGIVAPEGWLTQIG